MPITKQKFPKLSVLQAASAAALVLLTATPLLALKKTVVPSDEPTIQAAIDKSEDGDTVFVKNGTYKETISLSDGIVLIGQSTDKTVLSGDRKNPVITVARNAVIMNFTIENGTTGILCENASALIERNFIRGNIRTGIQCIINLPSIRNNIIAGNQWSGIFCELISRAGNAAIENNIVADNGYCGIMLSNRSVVLVQNNIIYRNREFGIFVAENAKRSRIIFNAIFGNRQPFNQYAVVDETNISKDPELPLMSKVGYYDVSSMSSPLKGLGKDGASIGLFGEAEVLASTADRDEDGIPDAADQCPDNAEDRDGYDDQDGCPEYDNDFDGLYDQNDGCPDKKEDFDGFKDTDGCPDEDNDEDGIPDAADKCPNKPETKNKIKDTDGCPD
jgi:hypothetical protein